MTPQEQDLVKTLVGRLTTANRQPKDAEAEAVIRKAVAEQPDAPYYLMQTALIQDLSLTDAQGRIERLEKQLAEAQPPSSTSFLGAWFGPEQAPARERSEAAGELPTRSPPAAAQAPYPPQPGPAQPANEPQPTASARLFGGGEFLR
jgi:hypothetical protein